MRGKRLGKMQRTERKKDEQHGNARSEGIRVGRRKVGEAKRRHGEDRASQEGTE